MTTRNPAQLKALFKKMATEKNLSAQGTRSHFRFLEQRISVKPMIIPAYVLA